MKKLLIGAALVAVVALFAAACVGPPTSAPTATTTSSTSTTTSTIPTPTVPPAPVKYACNVHSVHEPGRDTSFTIQYTGALEGFGVMKEWNGWGCSGAASNTLAYMTAGGPEHCASGATPTSHQYLPGSIVDDYYRFGEGYGPADGPYTICLYDSYL